MELTHEIVTISITSTLNCNSSSGVDCLGLVTKNRELPKTLLIYAIDIIKKRH